MISGNKCLLSAVFGTVSLQTLLWFSKYPMIAYVVKLLLSPSVSTAMYPIVIFWGFSSIALFYLLPFLFTA